MKPAPQTRMIWATVVATPPRTPSAAPYAPTLNPSPSPTPTLTPTPTPTPTQVRADAALRLSPALRDHGGVTRTLTLIPDLALALALTLTLARYTADPPAGRVQSGRRQIAISHGELGLVRLAGLE